MATRRTRSASFWAGVLFSVSVAVPAIAATVAKIDDAVLTPLRQASVMRKIRLDGLRLEESTRSVIELEEFQVWAPGGKVIVHGEGGKITVEEPTPMRFYRGLVNGDAESFAYFSVDAAGHVYGLVATRDHRYAVTAQRRSGVRGGGRDNARDDTFDHFLTSAEPTDEIAPGATWECVLDNKTIASRAMATKTIHAGPETYAPRANALTGTQTYGITVEVETDNEYYVNAGSNTTAAQNYVTNLTGAVSTIYSRDLKTNVTQTAVNIYTSAADPWAATDSLSGLNEVGDYYHSSKTRTTSAVVFLSGKALGSGIAWEGVVCETDFLQSGHWGGPYSWCGGIGNLFGAGFTGTVPDPNGTVSGILYGMPSGTQNYWPLAEYAHELGHNMGGHHTHCVAITDAERTQAGFTDGSPAASTSNFVDHCYAVEGAGCFSGTNYLAGSQSAYKGTIMSYCHNVFSGGIPQSRFVFGLASEPSHHELDDYMLKATGPLSGGNNIVSGTTTTLSSITAPSTVASNSTGNTASVTNTGGQSYSWSITGGSITAGGSTNSVTFSAGASGSVVLTVTATNATKCSLRDVKTIPISSAAAPTNVVATAQSGTSVLVSWTASAGATTYEVVRTTTDRNTFSSAVCTATAPATSCTDTTASSNTVYLYKVRVTAPSASAFSLTDVATTWVFTDSVLTQQSTTVKAAHINELRAAARAMATLAGIAAPTFTWGDPTQNVSVIHAADITELRTAINTARASLSVATPSYSTPAPVAGSSMIQKADIADLRTALQ